MEAKILKTEQEHEAALEKISSWMSAEPGTPEADALELWSYLVEEYEKRTFPIDPPDPVAAIRFRMEQQSLSPCDLEPYLGGKSKVSEVLNGKRPLSLRMIRALHRGLGIPLQVLVQERRVAG
jgi:HTH-type transcriptional regulator / antitoxin HigA